jgi:hypothetical protein
MKKYNISKEDEEIVRKIFIKGIRESGLPIVALRDSGEGLFIIIHVDKNERIQFFGEVMDDEPKESLDELESSDLAILAFEGVHKNEFGWEEAMECIKEAKERMEDL